MDIERLKQAAAAGSLTSQAILGACYVEGYGVPVDYREAFRLLSNPAKHGVPRACYYLGYLYSEGLGVTASVDTAVRLYEFAAERGEFFAQIRLARLYANEQSSVVDKELAAKWYSAAANQQDMNDCDELREAKAFLASGTAPRER